MRRTPLRTFATAILLAAAAARADVYSDGNLTADLTRSGNELTGTFTLNGQQYAVKAHGIDSQIAGTFQAGTNTFDFQGAIARDTLAIITGGKTYSLVRKDAPTNPLANPAAAANAPTGVPAGYTAGATDDRGVALKTTKAGVTSVQDALSATIGDVGGLFDAKPTVAGAVEDQTDHKSGVAVLNGQWHHRPARGVVSCQLTAGGADLSVVLAEADAPPELWQKLSTPQNAVADAATKVPMREYPMPDGTGSVGLPDGWTTKATSMLDPMQFDGPDGARVTINGSIPINTPNGVMMQIYHRTSQMARQVGMPPPQPPPGLFADFAAPGDAVKVLLPQINDICRRQNLPTVEPGSFKSVTPATPQMPGGRAQVIEDLATWVQPDGTRTLMHGVGRYESAPVGNGADLWMMTLTSIVAPDAEFAKVQPTMLAILDSGKLNPEACARVNQQRLDQIRQTAADNRAQQNAQFEANQAAHREQLAGYDRYNHNWAVQENRKDRANDNFVEYIGGTRDVVDTATGTRTSQDLNDADGIASSLNAATNDPNRFRAVPLRDQMHPLVQP